MFKNLKELSNMLTVITNTVSVSLRAVEKQAILLEEVSAFDCDKKRYNMAQDRITWNQELKALGVDIPKAKKK